MALVNENFLKLKAGYLFPEIGRRVKAFLEAEPEKGKRLIRCGIGDVTEPLPDAAREAIWRCLNDSHGELLREQLRHHRRPSSCRLRRNRRQIFRA